MNSPANCPFCELSRDRIVASNEHALAFRDGFPVTEFHTLVIPRKHIETYFDLSAAERHSIHGLLELCHSEIMARDSKVEGFNIGWNCGRAAGQTVFHCHVHLIPRRVGDVDNPRGGVRGLIPGKGGVKVFL